MRACMKRNTHACVYTYASHPAHPLQLLPHTCSISCANFVQEKKMQPPSAKTVAAKEAGKSSKKSKTRSVIKKSPTKAKGIKKKDTRSEPTMHP